MKAKRYAVEARAHKSNTWESVYYTNDLDAARRYAAAMLRSEEVRTTLVVDLTTGLVIGDAAQAGEQ